MRNEGASRQGGWAKPITIGVIVGTIALALYGYWQIFGRHDRVVVTLDVGPGRQIAIQELRAFDLGYPMYTYEVFVGGVTTNQRIGLRLYGVDDETWPPLDFARIRYRVLKSANGDLVAIVPEDHPHIVLVFHDFFTGISWPHQFGKYGGDTMWYARRDLKERLAVLAKEYPVLAPAAVIDDSEERTPERVPSEGKPDG